MMVAMRMCMFALCAKKIIKSQDARPGAPDEPGDGRPGHGTLRQQQQMPGMTQYFSRSTRFAVHVWSCTCQHVANLLASAGGGSKLREFPATVERAETAHAGAHAKTQNGSEEAVDTDCRTCVRSQ